ncbi:hypothetical protein [Candidatus Nitrosotenuis cloacae]|jgi:hypothetical protein|uniref:hypothetical protein n=1 Tax=Candidatus Nitrosotenuis cloacae TaxID=1603555 RepID=UPI002280F4C3|nr:hypothetical protein [Candidatus Nitrosotenuis cloacae]
MKKSDTISFRLDNLVLEKLRKESEKQGLSLNVLVNQILKRYMEWDVFESKVGMIPVARPVLDSLFKKLSEKEVIDIAKKVGGEIVKDIATFMKGTMNLESFMSWFETRMNMSGFDMNHDVKNDTHTYIIKHDLGKNWSLYHKTVLELIFRNVLEKPISIETDARMITLTFMV